MADKIQILIEAILKKTTEQELENELRKIEKNLKPLKVDIDSNAEAQIKLYKSLQKIYKEEEKQRLNQEKLAQRALAENEKLLQYEQKVRMAIEKQKRKEEELNKILQERIVIYKQEAETKLLNLKSRYGDLLNNTDIKKQIDAFRESLNNLNTNNFNAQKLNTDFKTIEASVKNAQSAIKATNRDVMSLGDMFKVAWNKMVIWAGAGTLLFGTIRQIKEGISYITELDNALNEIRIVTNKTQQEVNNLALSYNKLAKEKNVTTKEVASTAADLFRQGLDEGQVEERMRAIIQYAKISGISLEESNKIITATANATGESVQKIIDIFAYLGDMTAAGADEIGEALQRVASTAENAGLSLEKISSWIATISSITRESASTIGRSLNSMISRYEQIREKGFNEEDATKINDVTKALASVDIQATDAYKQLLPIGEVIDKLGAKWDTLTKNEKAYVATALAGMYQRNRLITLLDNYSISLKNYEDALNAAGTAEQKFAIYQDSVQAKLDKLSATWEEFWQKSLNSDLIKGTIQALTTLIDTFGNLRTVLSLIATGFALWKGNEILNFFKALPKQIKTSIMSMQLFKDIQTATMMVAKGEATAIQGLTLSFQSLGMSIKTAFLSNPLGWIAVGITTIISLVDIFNQKQEEMRQKIEDTAQKAKEQSDRITELMGKYNELIDLVDKDKNAKTQLQSVQDELIKTLGLEKEAIDLVNDAREESIKKVREEAIEKLKANENALIAAKNLAEEEKKNKQGSSSALFGLLGGYEYTGSPILSDKENKAFNLMKTISGLRVDRSALGTFILMADYTATAEERVKILETALDALKDAGLENTNIFNQLTQSQQGYINVIDKAKEANDAYNKNIAQQLILQKENEIGIPKTVREFENFRKAILDSSSGTEDFKRVLDELLSQEFSQFAKQIKDNSNSIFDLSKSYENLLKSISDTSKELKTLNQVIADVRNGQSLSAEKILDLIEKYDLSADAIKRTSDGYTIELSALESVRKAKIQTALDGIENEKKHALEVKKQVESRLRNYGLEIGQLKNIAEVKKKLAEQADKIAAAAGMKSASIRNHIYTRVYNAYMNKAGADVDLARQTLADIEELEKKSKLLISILNDESYGVSSSKSSSSKSTPFSEQFDFINTKIKSLNQELKELQQQLDDTFSPADKQTIIDKMIVAQQKKADLLKKAIKTYEDSAQKELQKIPESLRSAIVSGSFNVAMISEKTYGEKRAKEISEAIKQYQSLTDTIIGLKNEYAEIDNTIRSLDLDKITLSFEVFDKKIRESDRALEELDYQLNLLKDNDYDKKAEILTKKIEIATKQVNEYEQELERLKAIVPANEEEAEKLQERIDELTKKFREGKISIKEYNDTFEETAKNLISTLLNTQKDIDKKNLENQLKEREKQIYDITEAEFEAYKKAKIEILKKQKEENEKIATEEAKELVRLLTEQIKLEEGISYKDIVNFNNLYKEIHNEKIKQYQDTIDMLERSNELEQQRLEREERILEIQELQLKLQNTLNNRNVQILRKKEDGSWEYDYVADPEKVEELQKQIEEKQKDFDEWERNNSLKQIKELLQQKIEQEQELIRISEETYNRIAEIETTKFNEHYENMDILAENMLDSLKNTYNNKWDEIINVLKEKVSIAEREYAKLLGASVAGVSVQIPNRNITAQTPSTGFGTTPTAESEAYARQLKEAVGGDREAFRQAEIARTEQVIANRKAQGLDTSAQEAYLDSLLKNTFKFEKGGLVDFTGLAWVDGSKTKPEAFLNPTQTKLIGKLADSLPNMANILNNFATTKMKLPSLSKMSNKEVKQIFNIGKLEFPNVRTADEIKAAILDLPRLSLQSAKAY